MRDFPVLLCPERDVCVLLRVLTEEMLPLHGDRKVARSLKEGQDGRMDANHTPSHFHRGNTRE